MILVSEAGYQRWNASSWAITRPGRQHRRRCSALASAAPMPQAATESNTNSTHRRDCDQGSCQPSCSHAVFHGFASRLPSLQDQRRFSANSRSAFPRHLFLLSLYGRQKAKDDVEASAQSARPCRIRTSNRRRGQIMQLVDDVVAMKDEITGWRRSLHADPELLFDVHNTAAFVADKLRCFRL
jgi:hypothetical protein